MLKGLFIGLVKLYQLILSPFLPNSCRHVPTCSDYMIQAIQEWGLWKGTGMGLRRLSRCHPWGTHGYDPVPKRKDNVKTG